jgi:hypothetical protein
VHPSNKQSIGSTIKFPQKFQRIFQRASPAERLGHSARRPTGGNWHGTFVDDVAPVAFGVERDLDVIALAADEEFDIFAVFVLGREVVRGLVCESVFADLVIMVEVLVIPAGDCFEVFPVIAAGIE